MMGPWDWVRQIVRHEAMADEEFDKAKRDAELEHAHLSALELRLRLIENRQRRESEPHRQSP